MEHPCESDHRQKEERGRGRRAGKFPLSSGVGESDKEKAEKNRGGRQRARQEYFFCF